MQARQRYNLLHLQTLGELLSVTDGAAIQLARRGWVEEAVRRNSLERDSCWSESLAVGNEEFIAGVKAELGFKGRNRTVTTGDQGFVLRENEADYAILPLKIPF